MRIVGLFLLSLVVSPGAPGSASLSARQVAPPVTLDLVITTSQGDVVRDLHPQDLIVRLNGRPQTILDIAPPSPSVPVGRADLPPPYGTNLTAAGRAMAILVDVGRVPTTQSAALQEGLTTLTGVVSAADRLALIPLSTDLRPVDFTTSHERVRDAAATLSLRDGPRRTPRQDEIAVDLTLAAATRAAALLGGEPGVKTLVLVTPSFTITSRLRRSIQTLGEAVARHRVALYVVVPGVPMVTPTDGTQALAAGTGGLVITGNWADVVTRERARVTVTVAPDQRLDAGGIARALITTARPDVIVRGAPYAHVPEPGPEGLMALTDMLRQPRVFTDLPMRVGAYTVLHSDRSSLRLVIVAETVGTERPLQWTEFGLITPDGRIVAQWSEERDALARRPLLSGVLAPEGQYRLRWAASELSGRRGTADTEIDVRLTPAGLFRLSALMIGRLETDTFVPVLQPPPGTTDVEWYAEVYGDLADGQTLTARIDVAQAPGTPALRSVEGRVVTSPDPARRAMTGQVDMADLPPGDYLLRATLIVNGVGAGSVTKTLRLARE